jgi:hypothetical protein
MAAARRSLEPTGGELTGPISVAQPDEAERRVIIGITGVHQPEGTKRLTVPLAELVESIVPTLLSRPARRGRLWHPPSSLRFLVVPAASCGCLLQPNWLHHRQTWCKRMMASQVRQGRWVVRRPSSPYGASLHCR